MLRFARRTFQGTGPKAVLLLSGVLAVMALVSLGGGGEVNAVPVRQLEEKPTKEGIAMAATLIGSISFMMCLYYFVNYDDKDIKQKSWETISSTISIFCAVLLWSSFNDYAETYVIEVFFGEGETTNGALLVDILHSLFWFAMMQLALGWLSRATGPWQVEPEDMEVLEKDPEKMEEVVEDVEIKLSCFAVLLAHITGFATINAFGTVQLKYFSASPLTSFLAVPLAFFGQLVLQRVTDNIRERISRGDDGKVDEFEKKWDEETEEAENDVMGLTLSFLTINAMRFSLTGCLPNQEGKEDECHAAASGFGIDDELFDHTPAQKFALIGLGFFFTGMVIIVRMYFPEWLEEEKIEEKYEEDKQKLVEAGTHTKKEAHDELRPISHRLKIVGRLCEGVVVAISMCFSWSFFYGLQMALASFAVFEGEPQLLSVVLALTVSIPFMFGLIPLDWLADQDWTDDRWDAAIRGTMTAMALTIGFAWEQCFDACVDAIAVTQGKTGLINVHSTKLALTVFCASLLIPAWYRYILPFMVKKGWNSYGYVLHPSDIGVIALRMQAHHQEEFNNAKGENEEKKREAMGNTMQKMKQLSDVLKAAHAVAHDVRHAAINSAAAVEEGTADHTAYRALPEDDNGALREKNRKLADELEKSQAASLKCQQMLDQTMESMFSSLKVMNVTVSKIEDSHRS